MTIRDGKLIKWIKKEADKARLKSGGIHWKKELEIFKALKRTGLVSGLVTYIESDDTHALISYDHPYLGGQRLLIFNG